MVIDIYEINMESMSAKTYCDIVEDGIPPSIDDIDIHYMIKERVALAIGDVIRLDGRFFVYTREGFEEIGLHTEG